MKMKNILCILILVFVVASSQAQIRPITSNAEISVLTCAPGELIYEHFGHSAIRVQDKTAGVDYVFNWGLFSFDSPNFVWRFVKGETDYQLGIQYYRNFIKAYKDDKRQIYEQKLNLTDSEKEALYAAMIENYKPENRVYRYNFLFDNCATRIDKMISSNISGEIIWNDTGESKTFRELIDEYVPIFHMNNFGMKLALGLPTDRSATFHEQMFLPDYVLTSFQEATVKRGDQIQPLVKSTGKIFEDDSVHKIWNDSKKPFYFLLLFPILILFITFGIELRKKVRYRFIDFTIFFIYGLGGFVLLFLWFISVHPCTTWNLNILWLVPLHFFLSFFLLQKNRKQWVKQYAKVNMIVCVCLCLSMPFLPQTFHFYNYCFILPIMARCYSIYKL